MGGKSWLKVWGKCWWTRESSGLDVPPCVQIKQWILILFNFYRLTPSPLLLQCWGGVFGTGSPISLGSTGCWHGGMLTLPPGPWDVGRSSSMCWWLCLSGMWSVARREVQKSLSMFVLLIPAWPSSLPEAGRVFIAGMFDVPVAFPRPCLIPLGSVGSMRLLLVFVLQAQLPESEPAFPRCLQWIFP